MSSSKYLDFTAEDFAIEDSFVRWANGPNASSDSFWEEWVKNNPDMYEEIIIALALVRQIKFKDYGGRVEGRRTTWERIQDRAATVNPIGTKVVRNLFGSTWIKVAASVIIFLAIGPAAWHLITDYSQPESKAVAPTVLVKSNPKGRKSTFKLSDGTMVKLNADSRLKFINSADLRSVELKGEAYFEVAHDPSRPFVVKASGIITRVLGTDFNVKAFPEDREVEVALQRGRVVVSRYLEGERIDELILSPSEMFTYNDSTNRLTKSTFDSEDILAWKDGVINFKGADFYEMETELERWFGVDIFNKSEGTKEFKFTGKFRNESLKNILDNISIAMKFRYEIIDRKITVY